MKGVFKKIFRRRQRRRQKDAKSSSKQHSASATTSAMAATGQSLATLSSSDTMLSAATNPEKEDFVHRSARRCESEIRAYIAREECCTTLTTEHVSCNEPTNVCLAHVDRTDANECIMCWEEYVPNETVVWSAMDQNCKHVFHESCMIKFVTNHERRRRRLYSLSSSLTAADHESYSFSQHEEYEYVKVDIPCPKCRLSFMKFKYEERIRND